MRRQRVLVRLIAASAGVALLLGSASVAAAEEPHPDPARTGWAIPTQIAPLQYTHGAAASYSKHDLAAAPVGSNNFDCRPGPRHPRPVILAHGSDSNAYSDWAALSPRLAADGYCVFALNYGGEADAKTYGIEDMTESGKQLAEFVDLVLAATKTRQVDMIGYSQGATVTRYYTNRLGGAPKVGRWIGMASPTYGGIMYGAVPAAQAIPGLVDAVSTTDLIAPAVLQQMQGSAFLEALNKGGDTVPGPVYTTIGSKVDEMIQPFGNIALRDPKATNIAIQDGCPADLSGHFNMVYDQYALQLAQNALDPQTAVAPTCVPVALGTGIPEVIWSSHS